MDREVYENKLSKKLELYLHLREKKIIDALLVIAVIIPIVLLFWPFAMWNDLMSVILRVIPSFAVQVLVLRVGKWNIIKALPILITGIFAVWGTYLYFTSPHWSNATFWGSLIADYASPFISCLVTLLVCILVKKK
ncbi:MAG: hypothetical protein IKU39_02950 [Lachnospiraceae bacterium]|nr:hypothetical protein [Lachnospiraceae bacterium]